MPVESPYLKSSSTVSSCILDRNTVTSAGNDSHSWAQQLVTLAALMCVALPSATLISRSYTMPSSAFLMASPSASRPRPIRLNTGEPAGMRFTTRSRVSESWNSVAAVIRLWPLLFRWFALCGKRCSASTTSSVRKPVTASLYQQLKSVFIMHIAAARVKTATLPSLRTSCTSRPSKLKPPWIKRWLGSPARLASTRPVSASYTCASSSPSSPSSPQLTSMLLSALHAQSYTPLLCIRRPPSTRRNWPPPSSGHTMM